MSDTDHLQFEQQPGCLIIRTASRAILEQMTATFQAMAAAIKARPVKATLVDVRAVPGPVTFMDHYQLGEHAGQYLTRLNVGVLARAEQTDPQRIGQQVARNRGASIEIFTDAAAAEAWLGKHAQPA